MPLTLMWLVLGLWIAGVATGRIGTAGHTAFLILNGIFFWRSFAVSQRAFARLHPRRRPRIDGSR